MSIGYSIDYRIDYYSTINGYRLYGIPHCGVSCTTVLES